MEDVRQEYLFAHDLVTYVMREYLPSWQTVSLVPRSSGDQSRFTRNAAESVRALLEDRVGQTASGLFDYWFKNQQINLRNLKVLVHQLTIDHCMRGYSPVGFLEASALIAEFSSLAYLYGVYGSLQYAIFCITHILTYFRRDRQFSEASWAELDKTIQELL